MTKKYTSIDKIANASLEELAMTPDVGLITAESIYEFFRQPQTIDLIEKLKNAGVNTLARQVRIKMIDFMEKPLC